LVRSVSNVVNQFDGNWLDSKMSLLAGRFAGLACVEIAADKEDALTLALQNLPGVVCTVEAAEITEEIANTRVLGMNIVGPDRPGIVHDVTLALEAHVANVVDMETHIAAAPMSGELTFSADASIEVPYEMDWSVIADQLDEVATKLGVDILLDDDSGQ
jgi:glycine cleavage system regulatory protein